MDMLDLKYTIMMLRLIVKPCFMKATFQAGIPYDSKLPPGTVGTEIFAVKRYVRVKSDYTIPLWRELKIILAKIPVNYCTT